MIESPNYRKKTPMISPALVIFTKGLLHTLGLIISALENNLHFIKGWAFNWRECFVGTFSLRQC